MSISQLSWQFIGYNWSFETVAEEIIYDRFEGKIGVGRHRLANVRKTTWTQVRCPYEKPALSSRRGDGSRRRDSRPFQSSRSIPVKAQKIVCDRVSFQSTSFCLPWKAAEEPFEQVLTVSTARALA